LLQAIDPEHPFHRRYSGTGDEDEGRRTIVEREFYRLKSIARNTVISHNNWKPIPSTQQLAPIFVSLDVLDAVEDMTEDANVGQFHIPISHSDQSPVRTLPEEHHESWWSPDRSQIEVVVNFCRTFL
jgi:hypothetical protein